MAQTIESVVQAVEQAHSTSAKRAREDVRYRISQVGIIPTVRVSSEEDAIFIAEALADAGIPLVEISMTFPGAVHAVTHLTKHLPSLTVGAGSLVDAKMARRCWNEGAQFLTTDGFIPEVVEFATREEIVVFPGALTPTEVITAWKAGSDFVKVVPCDAVGGANYIRSLKTAIPQVRLIAAGGVNQKTALGYITAGATALGVGRDLIPAEAIQSRQAPRIQELARRFLSAVASGRN